MKLKLLLIISMLICVIGCERSNMKVDLTELKNISQEKWDALANKKIYFGHQSVGYNIIDGLNDIIKEIPEMKLNIKETKNPNDLNTGIFAHSSVGRNCDPISKIDDFKKIMDSGVGDKVDIAFFKFCYVDVIANTDIDKIFKYYIDTFEYLAKKYPKVKFVHSTTPLTTIQNGLKAEIKKIIGKKLDGIEDNIKRNLFNQKLLEKYGDNVFNLAKFEATYPNGAICQFENSGKIFYCLIPQYTTDGGHLKDGGKLFIGKRLIEFLLKI